MPYAFNDDKSKYNIGQIRSEFNNLKSTFDNLFIDGTDHILKVSHGGSGNNAGDTVSLCGLRLFKKSATWRVSHDESYKEVVVDDYPGMNRLNTFIIGTSSDDSPNLDALSTKLIQRSGVLYLRFSFDANIYPVDDVTYHAWGLYDPNL